MLLKRWTVVLKILIVHVILPTTEVVAVIITTKIITTIKVDSPETDQTDPKDTLVTEATLEEVVAEAPAGAPAEEEAIYILTVLLNVNSPSTMLLKKRGGSKGEREASLEEPS